MLIMKTGFVQMPLEMYNELMLENKRMMATLDSIVKIEADWKNEPILRVDLSKLAAQLNEKFEQSEFAGKWTMKDMSDHVGTIWDAFKKIPEVDNEDQA
jgi:hypothetical protein